MKADEVTSIARTAGPSTSDLEGRPPIGALRPTARGIGLGLAFVALSAVGAVSAGTGLVVLAAAVGIVLVASPSLSWRRARRAAPGLDLVGHAEPSLLPVGGRGLLRVTARNRSAVVLPPVSLERPDGRWTLQRAPGPLGGSGRPTGRLLRRWLAPSAGAMCPAPPLAPGESVESTRDVPTGVRGLLELPPLGAWVHDPLGLFGVLVGTTPVVSVAVHPAPPGRARPRPVTTGSMPADGGPVLAGVVPGNAPEGGIGELDGLRPYVPGDRLHLVHWPALARHDLLLVRRFHPETAADVRLVLDDRAGAHRRADFEEAVGVALGLADAAFDAGAAVELRTLSGRRITGEPTPGGRATLRTALADLWPVTPAMASGPGDPAVLEGATVVTTPTGVATLPLGRARPTVVVAP